LHIIAFCIIYYAYFEIFYILILIFLNVKLAIQVHFCILPFVVQSITLRLDLSV